jgi:hypothetical protein
VSSSERVYSTYVFCSFMLFRPPCRNDSDDRIAPCINYTQDSSFVSQDWSHEGAPNVK